MEYPADFIGHIICGDCIDLMESIPTGVIDLVVTSPPYGNLRDYQGAKLAFKFEPIAELLRRILKPGGVVVWVVGDATVDGSESGESFRQALGFKQMGFKLHDTMIYEKANFSSPASNRYHQAFEYMFVFVKNGPVTFNPIKDRRNLQAGRRHFGRNTVRLPNGTMKECKSGKITAEVGMRFNIWRMNTAAQENICQALLHPAVFPLKLAEDHIRSWSNEGDLVLDPMCGSGTTCVAAIKHNRRFIGMDIVEDYCKIASDRVAEARQTYYQNFMELRDVRE